MKDRGGVTIPGHLVQRFVDARKRLRLANQCVCELILITSGSPDLYNQDFIAALKSEVKAIGLRIPYLVCTTCNGKGCAECKWRGWFSYKERGPEKRVYRKKAKNGN